MLPCAGQHAIHADIICHRHRHQRHEHHHLATATLAVQDAAKLADSIEHVTGSLTTNLNALTVIASRYSEVHKMAVDDVGQVSACVFSVLMCLVCLFHVCAYHIAGAHPAGACC